MYRNKRKRKLIIFSLIGILMCMVAGYAAFQTKLEVKGTSKVTSNWNIIITNVTDGSPTGTAENASNPSWTDLTAYMEANLYEKGDVMEYDVTIENKGTIDAKLNDILTNLENNNEAVIITFSGYIKGEVLKSGESKIVHVKIEYNPSYEGEETSSEVKIDFEYTQNNNETENPDNKYLLTYDYVTNGGESVELNQELVMNGSNVDLSNKANKEGWIFIGWNTDKDATEGLSEYKMPSNNSTLYAIYGKTLKVTYEKGENIISIGKTEDTCTIYNNETSCEITLPTITAINEYVSDGWYNGETKVGNSSDKYNIENDITLTSKAIADNVGLTISTTSTTNSITVVANASATSGISKYEFSKDGGSSWTDGGTNKTYTFTKLTQGTNYNIQARVTSKSTKKVTATKTVITSTIVKPTYKEASSAGTNNVTITFPSGCGSTYTCTYQKNQETTVTVKATTATVSFTTNGSVVAKVSDGTNSVSSSYNAVVKYSITTSKNSTVNLTVTPNTTLAQASTTVTFTVPSSSSYTYQGAYVYNSSGTRVMTLNSSTKSFKLPAYNVRIAPIFKYNDKYIINGNSRDTTFSMNKYDANASKPLFAWNTTSEAVPFYALQSSSSNTATVDSRGQATSAKTYNVSHYCSLNFVYGGSYWKGTGDRVLYYGLSRDSSKWIHEAKSPDYLKTVTIQKSTINYANRKRDTLNLSATQSGNNNYYIVYQYLTHVSASSLDVYQIYFTGCTYYS